MSGYVQTNQSFILPSANYTVSAADTGKLFLIPQLGVVITITLPAGQAGLHYRFMAIATLAFTAAITPSWE